MPKIRIKRAANKVPTTTDLQSGELALNEATSSVYIGVGGTTNAASVVEVNAVRSVNSQTPTAGNITLTAANVGAAAASHTHPISAVTNLQSSLDAKIASSEKAAANGVATLDAGGKLLTTQLPPLAITEFLGTVANQTAMLALVGQKGDWAIRSDSGAVWIIVGDTPNQIGSWQQVSYPAAPVTSVAGKTGTVTLVNSDVSGSAPLASPALTGTPTAPTASAATNNTQIATTAFVKAQGYVTSSGVTAITSTSPITLSGAPETPQISLANATTSLPGAMSAADKTKLDGIAAGAQVNTVTSVAGKTGAVTLVKADVGLSNVANSDTTNAANIVTGTLNEARLPTIDGGTF